MRLVSISELNVGDTIARDIVDNSGDILITANSVIKNESVIIRLRELGIFGVYIEDSWSADIFVESAVNDNEITRTLNALALMDMDTVTSSATLLIDRLSNSAKLDNNMQLLRTYDEYTFSHSFNVAVLSITLGIGLGFSYNRLKNLAAGSLLHDLGKQLIPLDIINKQGRLNDSEFNVVKRHPEDGYNLLCNSYDMTASIKDIAYQHHENWDGTGYPRGLKGDEIYDLAHLVHVCDVFDALVSKRAYKDAFSVTKAIQIINEGRDTSFKSEYVDLFFRYIPVFPNGSSVLLSNNKKALVFENNKGAMLKPTVLLEDKTKIDLRESNLTIIK